ncbi:hypothetical protein BPOR_1034g00020 [Botrytis porri]|uniref:Uncharacterized protein n=1 Tax=Botrytis porri TaxID=87229 RepID=A0A4Z1K709_9HELO|nr:hypothetical protein BPOR_1034g00020 [Botrytis porri]
MWGAGRHPVFVLLRTPKTNFLQASSITQKLRFEFAKLEQLLIVAMFLTRFDHDTCDDKGTTYDAIPPPDLNARAATKPTASTRLRYGPRDFKAQD